MKRLLSTAYTEASFNIAALVLRATFGILLFAFHGIDKLTKFSSLRNSFFDPFHIGHQTSLLLVLFAEVFCALFVILGLFTRLAAIPIVISMTVAVFLFHKGQPVANYEKAILFLGGFFGILLVGPGRYSVDGAMGK
jgi:putative oxidoreductase